MGSNALSITSNSVSDGEIDPRVNLENNCNNYFLLKNFLFLHSRFGFLRYRIENGEVGKTKKVPFAEIQGE